MWPHQRWMIALAKSRRNAMTAKSEVRHLSSEELSPEELDAVSGGWSLDFGFFKVTGGDVADAAKWAWGKLTS